MPAAAGDPVAGTALALSALSRKACIFGALFCTSALLHAAEVAISATSEKEKRATGERKDLLQKKKALFRERLAQRKRSGLVADDDSDEEEEP